MGAFFQPPNPFMRLSRDRERLVLKETLRTVSMHEIQHHPPLIFQQWRMIQRRINPIPDIFDTKCRVAEAGHSVSILRAQLRTDDQCLLC
jgi:hypothetical protein